MVVAKAFIALVLLYFAISWIMCMIWLVKYLLFKNFSKFRENKPILYEQCLLNDVKGIGLLMAGPILIIDCFHRIVRWWNNRKQTLKDK